jgi:hypothetical protein
MEMRIQAQKAGDDVLLAAPASLSGDSWALRGWMPGSAFMST